MKKLNLQLAIIVAVFVVILGALIFFVTKPRYQTLKYRRIQLNETKQKLDALLAKKSALLNLKKDQKRIEEALEKAQGLLPKTKMTTEFANRAESAIESVGAIEKNLKFPEEQTQSKTTQTSEGGGNKTQEETGTKTTTPKKSYQTVTFSIGITSDYKQLIAFLDILENLSRLNIITNLTLSVAQNDLIDTKLDGEIYYK